MSDYIVSHIRTLVPVAVGYAVTWLAVNLGVVVSDSMSVSAALEVAGGLTAAYYVAARWLGKRWPVFERFLGATKQPTY